MVISFVVLQIVVRAFGDDQVTIPSPSDDDVKKVTAEMSSGDGVAWDAGVQQIHIWMKAGRVQAKFFTDWEPQLMKAKRYQDVADLALEGALGRPSIEVMTGCFDVRIEALAAMGKYDDALQCAKSYYNVCQFGKTDQGIKRVGPMLGRCHPDDLEIIRRFQKEQGAASSTPLASAADQGAATQPGAMLKSVKINESPFRDAIDRWGNMTLYTEQRVSYGNVLLAADRGADAEKLFRELYQVATSQDELITATEGIARSMRAEDGNVARADAWLASLQEDGNAGGKP